MDLRYSAEDEAFRAEVRDFLETSLSGEFAVVRGRGGPGDEHALFDERLAWERHLGAHGWTCVGWPKEHGGRGLSLHQQVIYFAEYAAAWAPGRVGHIGETLLGPTVIAFGTAEQQQRFLPPIVRGEELWCQGYSEPEAGSDLANLRTKAVLDEAADEWVVDGQKVWTSLAHWADWCFVLARTNPDAPRHKGISYLLVPMRQPSIEIRPIVQLTGDSEFSEVFFTGARAAAGDVVGGVDNGWAVAMGTLAFERGVSTLGQNLAFASELEVILEQARAKGRLRDPALRQRIAGLWIRLQLMRLNALRVMSSSVDTPPAAMITKLFWATLHRDLGELAIDIVGAEGGGGERHGAVDERLRRLFLYSRASTIYGGANQIQRNLIGERALGLPREPR
ncbi:MAG: acyl-CoA dehydrogenase family protein [Actinomycetota bacterium]|nr:acyl-CoA dehydrogenase family protein [Acidimicrobiia bacterium]MDQ3293531.1 acyl-CoA dehydrogenase family protein [Actinomycetota bacterium]